MESFRKGSTIVGPTCYANLTYKVYILILLYNNCQTRQTLAKVNEKETFDCPKLKNVLNNEYPFSKKIDIQFWKPKTGCAALLWCS